jgi:hypothetical protein
MAMTVRAEATDRRTYRRPIFNDKGGVARYETFDEEVFRSTAIHINRLLSANGITDHTEFQPLVDEWYTAVHSGKASPAGRTRWLGGTDIAFDKPECQFNCSFKVCRSPSDYCEVFWLELCGCGTGAMPIAGSVGGFSPSEIRVIHSIKGPDDRGNPHTFAGVVDGEYVIRIGDSAEGWVEALRHTLTCVHPRVALDASEVRGAGGRLNGFGWLCNGSEAFLRALEKILDIRADSDAVVRAVQCGRIINWLGTVLSTRRSAQNLLMAAGDPEAEDFATLKAHLFKPGNDELRQSNNSLIYDESPGVAAIKQIIENCLNGIDLGIVNRKAALHRAPWFVGVNPCVTGDTPLMTPEGHIPIVDVVGKEVEVWNGEEWSAVTPFSTGVNPIVRVSFDDGASLECTPYHKFILKGGARVEAQDLSQGDVLEKFDMPSCEDSVVFERGCYSEGFYAADGSTNRSSSWVYSPKYSVIPDLIGEFGEEKEYNGVRRRRWKHPFMSKTSVPVNGTMSEIVSWLAGYLDGDGTVTRDKNGNGIQAISINKQFLLDMRLMLTSLGVRAKVVDALPERTCEMPGGTYTCQKSWRLLINNTDTHHLCTKYSLDVFCNRLDLDPKAKPQRDARRFVRVVEVADTGRAEETYCVTEPKAYRATFNGIVTGNCFEILLADGGFCNLVDVNLAAFSNLEDLIKVARCAAKVNYLQACVDFDKSGMLSHVWTLNNRQLRLCGVGLTGIVQATWLTDQDLTTLRAEVKQAANEMAKRLGHVPAAAVTTVKPSGTLSKTMAREEWGEVAEGIHCPLGAYIFNWIGFSKHDPLVEVYRKANFHIIDHPTDSSGVLIKFPAEYRNIPTFVEQDGLLVNGESAITQFDRVCRFNKLWCDHNASCTLYVDKSEIDELAEAIHARWDDNLFTSLSFGWKADPTATPEDYNQKYLPQQVVSKDAFDAYVKVLGNPDFSHLEEHETFEIDTEECAGGNCPVR